MLASSTSRSFDDLIFVVVSGANWIKFHQREHYNGIALRFYSHTPLCFLFRYQFLNDSLEMTSSTSGVKSHTRFCIQRYGAKGKFLVAHEEEGQTTALFTCMQITRRSNGVIQIKQAPVSPELKSDLCRDDILQLDTWLILDITRVWSRKEDSKCSLQGGFNMQVYDKATHSGVCDGYLGETRLESECLPGEGLNFYFRQAACVPDGLYMFPTQKTYCLANWAQDGFNFILLGDDRTGYLWLFRHPPVPSNEKEFVALLLKDLCTSTGSQVTATNEYLMLTMSRQSPKMLDSLCYDDYEICSVLSDPCSYSEEMAWTCPKTCGFCSDANPSVCTFPQSNIYGTWTNPDGHIPDVRINRTSVYVSYTESLHCVSWDNGTSLQTDEDQMGSPSDSDDTSPDRQMVVTVSPNGCRPRYSCLKFHSMTNVQFMQVSQTKLWPLVHKREETPTCGNFVYTSEVKNKPNPFRSGFSTLLLQDDLSSNVTCDLSAFAEFDVHFPDGSQCEGNLTQNAGKTSLRLDIPDSDCTVQNFTGVRFNFVEYGNFPFSTSSIDSLLVTVTNETISRVHCWLFPGNTSQTILLVEAADCHEGTKRNILDGHLQPLVKFTKRIPRTLVTTLETPQQNVTATTLYFHNASFDNVTLIPMYNVTLNVTDDVYVQPSVLVMIGITANFIAVQISLCCSC